MSQDTNPSPKPDDIVQAAKQIVQAAKQEKLEQPHIHYAHPSEVTADPELSKDDKLHALENLEQDARQLADAAAEGMGGGERTQLHEVLEAKHALELPPFELAITVVLQGFRSKLADTMGTDAHALIANAIVAVEAACGAMEPG